MLNLRHLYSTTFVFGWAFFLVRFRACRCFEFKKLKIMNINEVAQWVIDNRYPKSEFEKLSDHELYHGLIEKIELVLQQNNGKPHVDGSCR